MIWLFPFFIKLGSLEIYFEVCVFFRYFFSFYTSLIWYGILLNWGGGCVCVSEERGGAFVFVFPPTN